MNQLITDTTLVVCQKQHCKYEYNRVNYCGTAGLIKVVEQKAQNIDCQSCHPPNEELQFDIQRTVHRDIFL